MLLPKTDWFWYTHQQTLRIDLGDNLSFVVPYPLKHLINLPMGEQLFSLQDTEHYIAVAENLAQSGTAMGSGRLSQILLNATAALAFHKPLSVKSWHFATQATPGVHCQLALLEPLTQDGVFELGQVLVLQRDRAASTCMSLAPAFQINATKTLAQFELIRVMNNRLIPYIADVAFSKRA
ncbi:MAG: cell division protein ZapC [Paraglaciecola sp.]|jgi:cell division protein ZapC